MGDKIPWDAWREMLVGLPAKSLMRSRAVCKTWLSIIDDPCFVTTHTNKQQQQQLSSTILIREYSSSTGGPHPFLYSVDLETLNSSTINGRHEISATPLNFTASALSLLTDLGGVASCNGLMLIAPAAGNWEIWNPLTHEGLELPHRNFNSRIDGFGLGYDSANQDLKAVVIDCNLYQPKPRVYETHVYSLKSDSWRKIMDYPRGGGTKRIPGVFLGGALHWISLDDDDGYKIAALNLGTESYRELKMPPYREINENYCYENYQRLYVLSVCLVVSDAGDDFFDLWARKDYGAEDSWTRVFQRNGSPSETDFFFSLIPVVQMKNKTQVLMQDEEGFCLFDLESGSVKRIHIHGLSGDFSAQLFHGTIFRLHDNCGGGRVSGIRNKRLFVDLFKRFKTRQYL